MANQGQKQEPNPVQRLDGLTQAARGAATKGLPPVHLWNPPEKVGIRVDDVPFLAVEMEKDGEGSTRKLSFRTNVDDWVPCDGDHRLRFEAAADGGLTPYLHVRADLWAKVTRALYYDLVEMGEIRMIDGREMFGVMSCGEFFSMADAAQASEAV